MPARRSPAAALAAAVLALIALPAPAHACSKDDTAYFDGFLDSSCLLAPLDGTTIDTFGGLRLATNGTPVTTSWDTDAELDDGISYQGSAFGPVGVSTLARSGTGAAAQLELPATLLPLTLDGANPVLEPAASVRLDSDGVDDPSVARVGSGYVMWYSGTAEDGSGPAIFAATSPDGRAWTRANGGAPVLTGTSGAFDAHGVAGPDVIYDAGDVAAPYRMYYAGRGEVFGGIGLATSTDGVTWAKHDDPATAAAADAVLEHGQPGSADSFAAADPSVLKDGATWKLWYTGDDSSKKRIAYATSADGVVWTKGGKVIAPEDPGANANYSFGAFAPTVFKPAGGGYRMLLTGRKLVSGTTFQTKVMDATSQDGIAWTAPSPALNPQSSSFDASNLNAPDVLADPAAGTAPFKLYYSGTAVDANGNFHSRIGYATSQNGSSFSRVTNGAGVNPDNSVLDIGTLSTSFDARQASGLSVALPASATPKYAGFYWGTRGSDFKPRIGAATSPDGSAWTKVAGPATGGALLPLGNGAAFDNGGQRDPGVLYDSATYQLYFTALDSSGVRSIGRASAPEVVATHQPNHASWSAPARVLQAGSGFDADGVAHPSVIKDGTDYVVYYTGYAGATPAIGRASSTSPTLSPLVRSASPVLAGTAGTFDEDGVKDPVVLKLGAADYRMLYSGVETTADGRTIERVGYATSANGTVWAKQGVVLNPSLDAYAADEAGVQATGLVADVTGSTLHAWTSVIDRTGRTRGGHATSALPTPPAEAGGIPSGWATYQLGDSSTAVRDFRSIARTSSGTGVTLWMSFLQPYSSAGSEFWSDPFPVTLTDPTEALNFLLTVRGVRWQARLSGPGGDPALDRVDLAHAPVSFTASGGATTTDITPPQGQSAMRWGDLSVAASTFSPGGAGSGAGTVTVLDAGSGAALASKPLDASGTTTISLSGVDPAAHPALRVAFALTSENGTATPLVQSLKVLYNALATPPPSPPPPPAPALTLVATPATIVFGQQATLSGQLTQAGAPLAGGSVSLLAQPAGATAFAPLASATTDAAGAYASPVAPTSTTTYKASFPGAAGEPTAQVAVKHLVRLKVRRSGTRGRFSGSVGPAHAGKDVVIEQLKSGAWAPLATVKTTSTSTFTLARKLKACKRYRFRATTAADADHLAGESSAVRVAPHKLSLKLSRSGRKVSFTGTARPAHPGKTVVLRVKQGTRFAAFAKAKLSQRSTFRLARKLKPGSYSFRAELAGDRCHFPGRSAVRSVTVP